MRLPSAPAPLLSPSGHLVSAAYGGVIALVETTSGARTDLQVAETDGRAIAISVDNEQVALHCGGRVAVTNARAPVWARDASVVARGAVYRAALGRETLVAAIRTGEHAMNLCAWHVRRGALEPIGAAEGLALGASAVYHLHLDETHKRVLLGGASGRDAFSGDGKPFTGIVELTPDLPLIWKGEGLPFRPHSYLFPLDGDLLGLTQRNRLARIDLSALPVVEVIDDMEWETPLQRTAVSPNGRWIAWMWSSGEGDGMRLRTLRWGDKQPASDVTFELDGNFPALAVDNEGAATAVAGARPDQMQIVCVRGDEVSESSVAVPSEPDE